jgi:hypothetical protein
MPQIAVELEVRDWQAQAALSRFRVRPAPRSQRLAAQRRRYTERRIAARVAAAICPGCERLRLWSRLVRDREP